MNTQSIILNKKVSVKLASFQKRTLLIKFTIVKVFKASMTIANVMCRR